MADLLVHAVPNLREPLVAEHIRHAWAATVGADVARRTRPQSVTNGCLHVVVDNSPWLAELTLRAVELTTRITARFGTVQSVRFTLGRIDSPSDPSPLPGAPPTRTLDHDDLREIEETVAPIRDPDVRAAARRLLGVARRCVTP